jgi:hypothetical protein
MCERASGVPLDTSADSTDECSFVQREIEDTTASGEGSQDEPLSAPRLRTLLVQLAQEIAAEAQVSRTNVRRLIKLANQLLHSSHQPN